MRRRILALLLVALLGLSGCFVFDELEKGDELMDKYAPRKEEEPAPANPYPTYGQPKEEKPEGFGGVVADLRAWWKKKSEKPPPQRSADDVPVQCEIDGHIYFMHKSVCHTRGGRAV
jgi:hypothetical protein